MSQIFLLEPAWVIRPRVGIEANRFSRRVAPCFAPACFSSGSPHRSTIRMPLHLAQAAEVWKAQFTWLKASEKMPLFSAQPGQRRPPGLKGQFARAVARSCLLGCECKS